MHLIKLVKDGIDYTFCNNGKILVLNEVNVPKLFVYKSEAINYWIGYENALFNNGFTFEYKVELEEIDVLKKIE